MNTISSMLKFIGEKIDTFDKFKSGITNGTTGVKDVKISDPQLELELKEFFGDSIQV